MRGVSREGPTCCLLENWNDQMTDTTSPSRGSEIEFYDDRWRKQAGEPIPLVRLQRIAVILLELSRLRIHAPRILDLGSGVGSLAGMLQDVGEVTAIELSPVAVELARDRWPRVDFIAGDFFAKPLPGDHFDVVVSQEVLEHVDDQPAFANLCHRVLRPGGYLILTTPNARVMEKCGKLDKAVANDALQPKENLLTVPQVRRLFRHRFSICRCYTIIRGGHKGLYRLWNSPRLNEIRLWKLLTDRLPIGLHTVLVARKPAAADCLIHAKAK